MSVLELSRWQCGTVRYSADAPPAVDQVDEIVVLEHGQVAERGTHAELIEADATYQRLWEASR